MLNNFTVCSVQVFHFDVFSIARWQEQYYLHTKCKKDAIMTYLCSNKINTRLIFVTVAAYPEYGGIRYGHSVYLW